MDCVLCVHLLLFSIGNNILTIFTVVLLKRNAYLYLYFYYYYYDDCTGALMLGNNISTLLWCKDANLLLQFC